MLNGFKVVFNPLYLGVMDLHNSLKKGQTTRKKKGVWYL